MKHGDISNKPAKQVMFRLEYLADKISIARITKKLTIEINDLHLVTRMNDLFMMHDVQLVIGAVLPKKYQKTVEDVLDDADLLFKEVILVDNEEEMEKLIKESHIVVIKDPYSNELLWI